MIITRKQGDIFKGDEKHIAFAVNKEGINDSGFAGMISNKYWPELATIGNCEIGTVLSKKVSGGRTLHALVCHSLKEGWQNQINVLKECFDKIPCNEEQVASIAIGTGFVGMLSGANFDQITNGIELSKNNVVLYLD